LQAGHFLANVFCTFAVEGYGILHRPRHLSGTQKALASDNLLDETIFLFLMEWLLREEKLDVAKYRC